MKFGIIVNRENYYIKVCSGGGDVKTRRHLFRGSLKNRRLMTKGAGRGGGQKSRKIDDVFCECRLLKSVPYMNYLCQRILELNQTVN